MAPDAEVGASQGEGGEGFNNEDWDAPGAPSDLGSLSAQTQWMDQQGGMSRNVLSPRSRPSLRPRPCLGARQVGSPSRRRRCRGSVLCLLACGRAWLGIVWGARHRGISVPWDIMASAGAAGPLRDASTACCRSATVPEAICVSGRAGCDAERLLRRGAQESGISMMNEMSASNQPVVVDDANIIDVWAHNMEAAFKEISEIVQTVPPPFTSPHKPPSTSSPPCASRSFFSAPRADASVARLQHPYVAMDTEFPGVVARPYGTFRSHTDYQYQTLKARARPARAPRRPTFAMRARGVGGRCGAAHCAVGCGPLQPPAQQDRRAFSGGPARPRRDGPLDSLAAWVSGTEVAVCAPQRVT
jgi:hypothetical protein